MIRTRFDYAAPGSLEEAVRLLSSNPDARPIAGGQGLLHSLKQAESGPKLLVDLGRVGGLRDLRVENDSLHIGAMATLAGLLDAAAARVQFGALGDAIESVTDPQVRNRATLGGSLADGHPSGDLPAAAIALDAVIHAMNANGTRAIPAEDFFIGEFQTNLRRDEIIVAIELPYPGPASGSAYAKFRNPASGYAICGVAAAVTRSAAGVTKCRVAVTGAGRHAARLRRVEAALEGKAATAENIAAAAALAKEEGLTFVNDLAASAAYRAHLTVVLAEQAIAEASRRSKK